jgi:serine/threonine protein kinase/Tfp pilus assembly protein PilF
MIGKTISHYKILEKLDSGGMGIVYKAQDLKLDRFVALKFLPPHLTTSEEEKQRFIHEAKAASALQHNNICAIHEIDETDDDQIFICMDYYEGETLDKKIKDKPFPIDEAIDIAIQIAQGLAIAHEKEIVHRDIKPANIMLTKKGVVKILDFGLAKLSTQTKLTKESTTLGTISYMSPEQAKGEEVDYRTDVWSLGVIIYEMLTGQLPFKGEYEPAVIYSIINDKQEPVTGLRTGVSMELERFINKCLQKNQAERYQHVDELIVDLQGFKKESETTSIPFDKEPTKKRPKSVILSIAIISIFILIVAGYFILIQPGDKSATGWQNSIAVLPFDNISNDPEQDYFCDGMTEQIISNLAKLPKLKVISRTSVMKYKATDKTIPEISKELNVAYVLEGSVRKFGDRIRVTAQLIGTEDDFHIWTENYDREYKELFDVQDDVSEAIAANLLANLSPQDIADVKTNRPSNTEAYEYYMKGRYFHLNKFFYSGNMEEFFTSEKMFKQAIKLDPNYADSYASLADLYNTYYNGLPDTANVRGKYMKLQEAYLDTAYNIDPNSAEVNSAKGYIHYSQNEDDEAFLSFKTAIKINPNNDQYYSGMGGFLHRKGCVYLSIKCLNRAIQLNPLYPNYYHIRGRAYSNIGEFSKAESDLKKSIELNPTWFIQGYYFFLLVEMKRYEEAKKLLSQLKTDNPNQDLSLLEAIEYAIDGKKEEALITFQSEEGTYSIILHAILGMKDKTLIILQKMTEIYQGIKRSNYFALKNFLIFDHLRDDPRFQEILAIHKEIYEENLAKYGDIEELIN